MPLKLTRRQMSATLAPAFLGASQPERPNLLMILSDDHSAEFLGASGNPLIQTPNLDRFASQGIRCTRMFTAAPQCVPSRTAFLTGRSPVAARMGRFTAPLPADVRTFAEDLREAGCFTGVCRRQHHLDGAAGGRVSGPIFRQHGLRTFQRRLDYVDISPPGQTVARMTDFFDRKPAAKPFFLWVNFNDPHHPWDSNAIPRPHDRKRIPVPAYLPDLPGVREDLGRYYDEIARMDGEFQSVLDTLEHRGFAENTLVLFMGDNGFAFPHGKGTLYDPGLNVPCLARWPGRVRPGSLGDALLSGEDVGPTFLEAAGLPVPKIMSGRSFLSLLRGQAGPRREHVFAARLTHGSRPFKEGTTTHTFDLSRMARSGRYKLIYNCTPHMPYSPVDSFTERGWLEITDTHMWGRLDPKFDRAYFAARPVLELYDMENDPAEMHNLAGRPELASVERKLTEALQEKMILEPIAEIASSSRRGQAEACPTSAIFQLRPKVAHASACVANFAIGSDSRLGLSSAAAERVTNSGPGSRTLAGATAIFGPGPLAFQTVQTNPGDTPGWLHETNHWGQASRSGDPSAPRSGPFGQGWVSQ